MSRTLKWITRSVSAVAITVAVGFALFVTAVPNRPPLRIAPADAIVVLTGGDERIREGARLLAEGKGRRLLISGVGRQVAKEHMRRSTGLNEVLFNCCVDLGHEAVNTTGNADETAKWARIWHYQRLIVVTSSYHMPRSLAEFYRALPNVAIDTYPAISGAYYSEPWWRHTYTRRMVVIEYLKFLPAATRLVMARIIGPSEAERNFADVPRHQAVPFPAKL